MLLTVPAGAAEVNNHGAINATAVFRQMGRITTPSAGIVSLSFGACPESKGIFEACLGRAADEDAATDHAKNTTHQLISGATRADTLSLKPSSIDQVEGDIIIRWQHGAKTLMLLSPAVETVAPKLYREIVRGNRVARTNLIDNPSATQLADSLRWILDGTAEL
jgi:hypothetical protein